MSNAQKTLQSGGQVQATPTPTPSAPPSLNINIPGLGGNQAPAGVTYTPGSNQYAQGGNQYAQSGNQYGQSGNQYTQGGNQYGQVSMWSYVALPEASIQCQQDGILAPHSTSLLQCGVSADERMYGMPLVWHARGDVAAVMDLTGHNRALQASQTTQTGQTMSAPTYSSAQSSNTPASGLGAIGSALAQALAAHAGPPGQPRSAA